MADEWDEARRIFGEWKTGARVPYFTKGRREYALMERARTAGIFSTAEWQTVDATSRVIADLIDDNVKERGRPPRDY